MKTGLFVVLKMSPVLRRPVPYEVNLQNSVWFQDMVAWFHSSNLELLPLADQTAQLSSICQSIFSSLC